MLSSKSPLFCAHTTLYLYPDLIFAQLNQLHGRGLNFGKYMLLSLRSKANSKSHIAPPNIPTILHYTNYNVRNLFILIVPLFNLNQVYLPYQLCFLVLDVRSVWPQCINNIITCLLSPIDSMEDDCDDDGQKDAIER